MLVQNDIPLIEMLCSCVTLMLQVAYLKVICDIFLETKQKFPKHVMIMVMTCRVEGSKSDIS